MDWIATKKLLDRVATDLLSGYKEYLFVHGLYPDIVSGYPQKNAEEDAQYFLEMKCFPQEHFEEEGTLQEMEERYGEGEEIIQHLLWRREQGGKLSTIPSIKAYAEQLITDHALIVPDAEYELFCQKVAEMLWDLKDERDAMVERLKKGHECFLNDKRTVTVGQPSSKATEPVLASEHSVSAIPKESMTFAELIEKYVAYKIEKQHWGDSTLRGNVMALKTFHEIFQHIKKCENVYIDSLSQTDVDVFEKILRHIPRNRKKNEKYKDCGIGELVRMANRREIPETDLLSDGRYNDLSSVLTAMMDYAAEPRQGFLKYNYFTNLKVKVRDAVKRLPFTNKELEMFFNTDLFKNKKVNLSLAWRYWIPILMLYHGTRLEEVAQPYISSIQKKDGIWCINNCKETSEPENLKKIRIKNENSIRIIPLHNKVLELGFLDYVQFLKNKGEIKIFPTLSKLTPKGEYIKHGKDVTKFFTEDSEKQYKQSYLTKCGIKTPKTEKGTKSLICFRHTVEKVLNDHPANVLSEKIDQLLGHAPQSIGKKHYSGYSEATIKEVVDMIDFPEANLPWDVDGNYNQIKFEWEK